MADQKKEKVIAKKSKQKVESLTIKVGRKVIKFEEILSYKKTKAGHEFIIEPRSKVITTTDNT